MKQNLLFYAAIICFAILSFCSVSAFSQIPTSGLMAYWNFDNNLIDTSANTHNLTNSNTTTVYAPGIKGGAVNLNGPIYLYSNDNFIPFGPFTISCWAKHAATTSFSYPTIIELTQGLDVRFTGSFTSVGGDFYYTNSLYASIYNTAPADTNWHHYMGIHDAANQKALLYIDGILVNTQVIGATLNVYGGLGGAYPCMVGGGSGGTNVNPQKDYDGLLDELLVYQVALDSNQAKAVYCDGFLTPPNFTISGNTLTISAGNRDSIQWMLNGSAISGATSASYTITASGSYTVEVFSHVGCNKTSSAQSVTMSTGSGINDLNAIKFDVAPNPTTDFITINSAVLNSTVTIYAIDGKNIYTDKISGSKKSIDVSTFAKGLYIIELKADGKCSRAKFIKE